MAKPLRDQTPHRRAESRSSTELRPIPRERVTPLGRGRSFRSPKEMISKGVQALSGFLSNISNNFYLDIQGDLQHEALLDTLARFMITHQKTSLFSLRSSDHFDDSEIQNQLLNFSAQAKRHVLYFENAIRDLNGNPQHLSAKNQTFRQWLDLHLKSQGTSDHQEIMDFENLCFLGSLQLTAWETLNEILTFCQDPNTKARVQSLVDECEDGIKEQNQWFRRFFTRQILKNLVLPAEKARAA